LAFDVAWHDIPVEGEGYSDSILELGFALGPDGPVAWVYEDPGDSANNRRLDVPIAIARRDGHTVYELRLPWAVFRDWCPPFGVAAVLNDVDGEGAMRHWSQWGGGVAGRKDPGLFLHLAARGE